MSLNNKVEELVEILKDYKFDIFVDTFISKAKERDAKMTVSLEAVIYLSILFKLKDDFETLNFIISSLNLNLNKFDLYLFLLINFYINLDIKDKLTNFCCKKNLDITMKELLKKSKLNIKQLENYLKISKENSSNKIIDLLESEIKTIKNNQKLNILNFINECIENSNEEFSEIQNLGLYIYKKAIEANREDILVYLKTEKNFNQNV